MSDCLDLNPARMRQARRYATGVTVVTAAGAQGPSPRSRFAAHGGRQARFHARADGRGHAAVRRGVGRRSPPEPAVSHGASDERSGSDPARMRQALGRYATGVTVVTAAGAQGPIGMTVNSFASVSLDPPLVLWSLRRASLLHAEFIARRLCWAPAIAIWRAFAQTAEDRYAGLDWYPGHDGLPVFDDCVARFECATRQVLDAGDHAILIGQVLRLHLYDDEAGALVFCNGAFSTHGGMPA